MADGAGLREGEGWKRTDEDDGIGFAAESFEDLIGDGGCGKKDGLVCGSLHELAEHERGEIVGLIAGGDADDGEVALFFWGGVEEQFGDDGRRGFAVVGKFGYEFADAEEEEVAAGVVEKTLVAILFDESESGNEDGVVELDKGVAFEEAIGDGVRLVLVHGEETLVEVSFGGELGVGAEEGVEEGELRDVATHDDDADGERGGEDESGPSPEKRPEDGHGEQGE